MGRLCFNNKFGVAPADLLDNCEISLRAKGLYAYIQSKQQDWIFSIENIAIDCKEDVDAIKATILELEYTGYLLRKLIGEEVDYYLFDKPTFEKDPIIVKKSSYNQDFLKRDEFGVCTCHQLRDSCVTYFKEHPGLYPDELYKEFIRYWSEPNEKNTPRWFSEKTKKNGRWNLPGRLATWAKGFKPKPGQQESKTTIPEHLRITRV